MDMKKTNAKKKNYMNVYVEVTHTAQSGGRGCHVLFVEARGPLNPSGTVG